MVVQISKISINCTLIGRERMTVVCIWIRSCTLYLLFVWFCFMHTTKPSNQRSKFRTGRSYCGFKENPYELGPSRVAHDLCLHKNSAPWNRLFWQPHRKWLQRWPNRPRYFQLTGRKRQGFIQRCKNSPTSILWLNPGPSTWRTRATQENTCPRWRITW